MYYYKATDDSATPSCKRCWADVADVMKAHLPTCH